MCDGWFVFIQGIEDSVSYLMISFGRVGLEIRCDLFLFNKRYVKKLVLSFLFLKDLEINKEMKEKKYFKK